MLGYEDHAPQTLRPNGKLSTDSVVKKAYLKHLDKMFNLYSFTGGDKKKDAYAEKLLEYKLTGEEVGKAVNYLIDTQNRLPAVSDIRTVAQSNKWGDAEQVDPDADKIKAQQLECARLKEMFLSKYNQEQFTRLLKQWFIGVYGDDQMYAGLTLASFEMPFLFDLRDSSGNIDGAVRLGQKKL